MIAVIGAGPAGSFTALKLAEKGYDVNVYEDHQKIGLPVQCTGLLTSQAEKIMKIDPKVIINTITKARLYSPNWQKLELDLQERNIVIDREKFDRMIANRAMDAGAKIFLRHKFTAITNGKVRVGDKSIQPDWLVGADGPLSQVAKCASLFGHRKILVSAQVRAQMQIPDPHTMEIFLGVGCFAWLVPESSSVGRLGVVSYKYPGGLLQGLVARKRARILEHQGGLIPLYDPKQKLQRGKFLLVGDAATQVKATSFGGIVPGMIAARELARDPENYEKNCRKALQKDLWLALKIRKALDKFSVKDYNSLLGMFQKGMAKDIIESHDRDFPSQFIFKLMLAQPRLLKYALKGFFA